jgi:nucleoside 2-deoxyribosyltransferase
MIININKWTSDLCISSNVSFELDKVIEILNDLEASFSKFNELTEYDFDRLLELCDNDTNLYTKILQFAEYVEGTYDFTGVLKGIAINEIDKYLRSINSEIHYIDFGGDILAHNCPVKIKASDKVFIESDAEDRFVCFTSGNTDKRGNHIICKCNPIGDTVTYIEHNGNPIIADMRATKGYADHTNRVAASDDVMYIDLKDGIPIIDSIYCASPFFNEEQIKCRDDMVSNFNQDIIFRPDLTEASKAYDVSPGKELADKIFADNVNGIKTCKYLMYPEGTNDLGTLFEVGHAIKLHKPVMRFNQASNTYTFIDIYNSYNQLNKTVPYDKAIINCNGLSAAVMLGFHSDKNLYYDLNGLHDNIMLSQKFTQVKKLLNNKYKIVERDNWSEID